MTESESTHLLMRVSNATGISGHEGNVRAIFAEELASCGVLSTDKNGGIYCTQGEGATLMLAAHMDEIGFLVQEITPHGFLQIVTVGGWWNHTLLSQRVVVTTRTGEKITGVIGSKPPHFLGADQRNHVLPTEALFVDIGAESADQVREWGIFLGDPVTPFVECMELKNPNRLMGKAFDNRAGVSAVIEAMKILATLPHDNKIVAAGTVQEEVGTRGAKCAGAKIQPDCVLVVEGPPADDTLGFPEQGQGHLGKGAQVRLFDPTAMTNPRLAELVRDVAIKHEIPFQITVRRTGGTDAAALHTSGEGIPCIVLGIPTRYIHAHNGILDKRDYRAVVDLIVALGQELDSATIQGLTQYL